jgi:hypothetical protein
MIQKLDGRVSAGILDANPANRATGHPRPVPCEQGIFFIFFLAGVHVLQKKKLFSL